MESRKGRETRTKDETRLMTEERARGRRHQAELQRLMRAACLGGSAYFRGNDRSPDDRVTDVAKAATAMLARFSLTSIPDSARRRPGPRK